MTRQSIARLALVSLTPVLVIAAAPALAQDEGAAAVPGNRYAVVNRTGAPLVCKYRVNSSATGGAASTWETSPAIAVGSAFSRTVQGPGESVSLNCNAEGTGGNPFTVRPGQRYNATKLDDGKVVVTRVRT